MRYLGLAALLLVAGCAQPPASNDSANTQPDTKADPASVLVPQGVSFDYRYAFRIPAAKVKAVQASHAAGCERLGPARCRINTARYRVGDDSHVLAMTTMMIDPNLARAFGDAATSTVTSAGGILVDARTSGAAATGSNALVSRLRASLATAETPGASPDQVARAARLRTALATIAEVEQNDTWGNATTPVVVTYSSGNVTPGMGGDPQQSFQAAGQSFLASLGGMAVLLSGIGPWLVLLLLLTFLLRKIVHSGEEPATTVVVRDHDVEKPGMFHRLFKRDEPPAPLPRETAED